MKPQPSAIGYLREDISGASRVWDENQVRRLAQRLGYDLRRVFIFDEHTDRPVTRLCTAVSRLEADAVVTPSAAHFGGTVPGELVQRADVITVSPEETYARTAMGELPNGVA
ncbi:hypothetical protein [Nocardia yamanashiensis]|uniref:hypothetical protein n=1 Tax=Nocardia yamanashiensis TaxID=209247 RepID=UPI000832364F|nr:hypothetical protein [Nocardia yamanashiensis]